MPQLEGQTALVTGGSRGIGRGIALRLAQAGATVVIAGRNRDALEEVVREIEESEGKGFAQAGSVAVAADAQRIVEASLEATGRIDILVNNAGITRDGLLMRLSLEHWHEVLDTNLTGAFNMTKAAVRSMVKQKSGSIINVSSIIGLMGNAGQANYAASKAGVIGFTKSIARELASRNITVNAVAPGYIETDMTAALSDESKVLMLKGIPVQRFGQPEDVAGVVLFLASPDARYITGQVISVDGGMAM
ncbi:MAG: 3-oxoacyl-[acyl-carrier-protein] reductase [Armatimonadetes bacterium CG2_30_59_28]|nr:3-oxoacyl-[acyl-carrier-protein] reductase [Armatimonadota bacterium]OIO90799.1 MAG: 3-oxoacyl-[acyl-carrier-protein] reductase [Armatimonadetes bacterium CG2_30_59_28]PIU67520.1 MAG: 3-oxoacyl-[acyl-carrier-protein] reductase [Armatimonadetes bacterium CG07_land_8_20_14_0_80_59_28]PIX45127.1 MAG: 3-oxoacyl-[acyl-carrier-protein] reductase [Armatimonadetes bacterium CG_4_8_14_3_um_filter_58_9]PIY40220.1 MAG: 3-oxoacyl-[acyl-carrier-protein] reductase [Armatimonadetes bacterium CG_4_10_14_3_u